MIDVSKFDRVKLTKTIRRTRAVTTTTAATGTIKKTQRLTKIKKQFAGKYLAIVSKPPKRATNNRCYRLVVIVSSCLVDFV